MEIYRLYPHAHEGLLTDLRTSYIKNVHLCECLERSKMARFVRVIPLGVGKRRLRFKPSGMSGEGVTVSGGSPWSLWNQQVDPNRKRTTAEYIQEQREALLTNGDVTMSLFPTSVDR